MTANLIHYNEHKTQVQSNTQSQNYLIYVFLYDWMIH